MDIKHAYMEYDDGDVSVEYEVEIIDDKCQMKFAEEDSASSTCEGHINWSAGHGICESCSASYSPLDK